MALSPQGRVHPSHNRRVYFVIPAQPLRVPHFRSLLQFTFFFLEFGLVVLAIYTLFNDLGGDNTNSDSTVNAYVRFNIVIGSIILGLALVCFAFALTRIVEARRQKKRWSIRRRWITTDAVVQLFLIVIIFAAWLAGYSLALASPCDVDYNALVTLAFVRWSATGIFMVWMLIMLRSMTLRYDVRTATTLPHPVSIGPPPAVGRADVDGAGQGARRVYWVLDAVASGSDGDGDVSVGQWRAVVISHRLSQAHHVPHHRGGRDSVCVSSRDRFGSDGDVHCLWAAGKGR